MPKPGANQVVIVRSDGFQHVQHRHGIVEHLVGATDQSRRISEITFADVNARPFQFPRGTL